MTLLIGSINVRSCCPILFTSISLMMISMSVLQVMTMIALLQLRVAVAQIPRACTDTNSLESLVCCPNTEDGICGERANRGECVTLNITGYSRNTTNVRENWPHYYTRGCSCNGNYAGYDCSRCKYGYYGSNCNQKQVLPRRSVAYFSDADWDEFNEILNLTRSYDSGYVVVLEESTPGNASLVTSNISVYGLFIWAHHYAAKDSRNSDQLDYAHSGPGFITWHRNLGLWLEWDIQRMLQSMGHQDYYTFRLPYWDWRRDTWTNNLALGADELFTENRLGATVNVNSFPRVSGTLYGNGWDTICVAVFGPICDPNVSTGPLQRCPFTGTEPCKSSNPDWPSSQEVDDVLDIELYDAPPFNAITLSGFRVNLDYNLGGASFEECRNDRMCRCIPSQDSTCSASNSTPPELTQTSHMHLTVHTIPGVGDFNSNLDIEMRGTIEDIAASPNDPLFILHHNMVDCVFIEWLRRYPNASYPQGQQKPGHDRDGYMVPFYPLYTNGDVFKDPEEFGYTCELTNFPDSGGIITTFSLSVLLVSCILTVILS